MSQLDRAIAQFRACGCRVCRLRLKDELDFIDANRAAPVTLLDDQIACVDRQKTLDRAEANRDYFWLFSNGPPTIH